jgi:acetylornithine deacetylase/succinyl-diaminopimelate desuccinylase-like protein
VDASIALPDGKLLREVTQRPEIETALRWFTRERSWITDRHLQLCRIPAPTFFEAQRASWFRDELTSYGWRAQIDRAGNVLAKFPTGSETGTLLAVSAHLDTVFAPAKPEDVRCSPDGRLLGPGTSDNGSGLSALLALAKLLGSDERLAPLAGSILLVANVGEEGEGNLSGMRYLCQHGADLDRIAAFLILDGPSTDHITVQALASRRYEVTVAGPGGHSWNDHGTPNPVHAMAEMIASFVRQADALTYDRRRGVSSYNFGVVEGGTSINSIPSVARAKLDLRSEDPSVLSELAALLTPCLERSLEHSNRSGRHAKLTAKLRDLGARPGGQLPLDAPLLQAVQSVDGHLGIRARVMCASTDANVPLSMGLQALSIGAGGSGGGAHTPNEWYQPDSRETGLRRIFLLLALWRESAVA